MREEGITVLEEWFRWAEEWSFLLRIYGGITKRSHVLEIGCGLGRTAFPLRFILSEGAYNGFEICKYKIDFLQKTFHKAHPRFNFVWANIHNTYYNPQGNIQASNYKFPYVDNSFDVVYAASVFTHMLPDIAENYFKETARVLKPNGRAVFSFFILDFYQPKKERSSGFARSGFNFDHPYGSFGSEFSIANPDNPEEMTAYKKSLIQKYAAAAGLALVQEPVPGFWSDSSATWVGAQDIVVLKKP
ncbi:class I SAM-dependent methyltransferase [Segetibacter sp. 3557_3]|uniref:class I SAM-dependent methyltransferase n=1 Tax=Segetibacter sp. 3557_3 TaxID=2547429 RepID=UPI001FB60EEE|nr:class I SAM-dependent methyltransferase [Segetibacter sp. 3557_3]